MRIGIGQAWAELGRNARRSLITIFSISLGVASMLIMNSLTEGNRVQSMKAIARMGGVSVLTIAARPPSSPAEEVRNSRSPGLNFSQVSDLAKVEPRIAAILPEGKHGTRYLAFGGKTVRGNIVAVTWEHFKEFNYEFEAQNPLERLDSRWNQGEAVCFLGEKLATALFGSARDGAKRQVIYDGVTLEVAGIIKTSNPFDWRAYQCFYPWAVFIRAFSSPFDRIEEIKIKLREGADPGQAAASISRHLLAAHRGVEDFEVRTAEAEITSLKQANRIIRYLGSSIAILALAVGTLGILNLMMATISYRLNELGIRKALGASGTAIMSQFVAESVSISCLGTILGIGLGFLPVFFPDRLLPVPPTYTWTDFLVAIGSGLIAGFVSGIYPALFAARLSPVEALRHG